MAAYGGRPGQRYGREIWPIVAKSVLSSPTQIPADLCEILKTFTVTAADEKKSSMIPLRPSKPVSLNQFETP